MTLHLEAADHKALLAVLIEGVLDAGRLVLGNFGGLCEHALKADASPVTESDRAAEALITDHLLRHFPDVPVVAEEAISRGHVPPDLGRRFFLVDPLDGTREFVAGLSDFTVNVALVEDGRPVCGVVFAPAYGELFVGSPAGAFKSRPDAADAPAAPRPIRVRARPGLPLALASRSHRTPETNLYLERFTLESVVPVGSSLKFCRIAEGAADLYPCLGRTMEWDTAAGQAVLEAAGGQVTRLDGSELGYAKRGRTEDRDFANPYFLAVGGAAVPQA